MKTREYGRPTSGQGRPVSAKQPFGARGSLAGGHEGSILAGINRATPIDERAEEGLSPGGGPLSAPVEELGAHERIIAEFEAGDERAKQKVLKRLATRTPLDAKIDHRQKNGQLRLEMSLL